MCVCAGLCLWIEGTDLCLERAVQLCPLLCCFVSLVYPCVCMCVCVLGFVVKWKIWRWWCRIWSLRPSRLWTAWRKEYSCLTCFSTCLDERSFSHTLSLQFTHTLSPPLKPCTLSDCYLLFLENTVNTNDSGRTDHTQSSDVTSFSLSFTQEFSSRTSRTHISPLLSHLCQQSL